MSPREVLRTRDEIWEEIYSSSEVMKTIHDKFGMVAVKTVEKLKKVPLKRKLLED